MFLFPKSFIKQSKEERKSESEKLGSEKISTFQGSLNRNQSKSNNGLMKYFFSDAKRAFLRFSKNSLLICHICGGVFRIIGYLGYYIVKPKYMELQYRQSASSASFFTG